MVDACNSEFVLSKFKFVAVETYEQLRRGGLGIHVALKDFDLVT